MGGNQKSAMVRRALKGVLVLFAVGCFVVLAAILTARASGITVTDISFGTGVDCGKVTFEIAETSSPKTLVVFDADGNYVDSVAIAQDAALVDYRLFDPTQFLGGDEGLIFFAVLEDEDLQDFDGATAGVTPIPPSPDGTLTVSWESGAGPLQFEAQALPYSRPAETTVAVAKTAPGNDYNGFIVPHSVKTGDTVIFTIETNERDFVIAEAVFEGKAIGADKWNSTDLGNGVFKYRTTVTVPKLTVDTQEISRPIMFSFTYQSAVTSSTTLTQASDCFASSPLTYFSGISSSDIAFSVETDSELEGRLVQNGDIIKVSLASDAPDRSIRVTKIVVNGREDTGPFAETGTSIVAQHTVGSRYGYSANAPYAFVVHGCDQAGNTFQINVGATDTYNYFGNPAPAATECTINDLIYSTDDCCYYIQRGDKLSITYKTGNGATRSTKYIFQMANDSVELAYTDVAYDSAQNKWTFTYEAELTISDITGLSDGQGVRYRIRKGNTNILHATSYEGEPIKFLMPLGFDEVLMQVGDGTTPNQTPVGIAIDSDIVRVSLLLNRLIDSDPDETELLFGGNRAEFCPRANTPSDYNLEPGKIYYYFGDGGSGPTNQIELVVRLPQKGDDGYDDLRTALGLEDDKLLKITLSGMQTSLGRTPAVPASTEDYVAEANDPQETRYNYLKYWAPLEAMVRVEPEDGTAAKYDAVEPTYIIVVAEETINLQFTTHHEILNDSNLIVKFGGQQVLCAFQLQSSEPGSYTYSAEIIVGNAPLHNLTDQEYITFTISMKDSRGQELTTRVGDSNEWAVYFEPLAINDVSIISSNLKDETRYCKDGDTITVQFTANHYVNRTDATIINKGIGADNKPCRGGEPYTYQLSYTLENGDLKDLTEIAFAFTATDLRGDSRSYTQDTPGVANRLLYYAPLEATTSIKSSNANPLYARNGDTVSIINSTNHTAQALDFSLGGRQLGDWVQYSESPTVFYYIPTGETELHEGPVFFSVRLEDPAGNYLLVNETNDNGQESSQVIYDRTPVKITILPSFTGFTNQDVSFSFLFSDANLDFTTLSCTLNGVERLHLGEGSGTSYTHGVELTEEGEYLIQATAKDLAGNEMRFAAVCHLTIDKTKPVVHIKLTPNTFAAGFTLENIITIEEEYLEELVCTVTDNEEVFDWALDLPFETEGKKAVYAMARDMAGNTSTPITFDIYIDDTPPQPIVVSTSTSESLSLKAKSSLVGLETALNISLAEIHMGDEEPDTFTTLQLLDEDGNLLLDFLATPSELQQFTYKLTEFGHYTLLIDAVDGVGNETGLLKYEFEFRKQHILERLLENTPLSKWSGLQYINDFIFIGAVIFLLCLAVGFTILMLWRRRRMKEEEAQEYIIIDDDE